MKTTKLAKALCAVSLLLAGTAVHAEVVPYLPGLLLGTGYDTMAGTIRQACVTYTHDNVPGPGALTAQSYSLSEISSNADMLSITGIDASASVDIGLFSASAEMALMSQNQINNYNANLLAEVSIERGWQFSRNTTLTPESQALADANPNGFRQQCGNRYVAGVLYGGEFYGLVTVATSSQSDRSALSSAFSASYGPFAGSGSFSNETLAKLSSYQTEVTGYISGGGAQNLPLTMNSMRTRMASFPHEIMQSGGTPIQILLVEYPGLFSPTAPGMYQLANLRWEYVSALAEVAYVLREPSQFYMSINTWRNFLDALKTEAQQALAAVDSAIATCKQDATKCTTPAGLRTPDQFRADLPPRYAALCGSANLAVPGLELNVLNLNAKCGGDNEIGGHNPSIDITSFLRPASDGHELNFSTKVKIREGKHDWTCFNETVPKHFMNLIISHPGCYLSSASKAVPSSGALSARGGNDNHRWTTHTNGTGYIESADCLSDTSGKDRGKLGCRSIKLRPIVATLDHEEGRMGPNDLKRSAAASWTNRTTVIARVQQLAQQSAARAQRSVEPYLQQTGIRLVDKPVVARPISTTLPSPTFRNSGQGTLPPR